MSDNSERNILARESSEGRGEILPPRFMFTEGPSATEVDMTGGSAVENVIGDSASIRNIRERLGLVETEKTRKFSLAELRQKAEEGGGLLLYHGGLPENTQLQDIDLHKLGSQQNKKGRTYGGFYLADYTSLEWAESYARSRNNILHGFLIRPDSSVHDMGEAIIDRLSEETRAQLVAQGAEVVKGKDILGRTQYVLLQKACVQDIGYDILTE